MRSLVSIGRYVDRIRSNPIMVGVVALSLFLNVYGVWWGLPFPAPPSWDVARSDFYWTHDSIGPVGPLFVVYHMLKQSSDMQILRQYPAFHYFVLFALYAPYMLWLKLSGGLNLPCTGYNGLEPLTIRSKF